MAYPVGVLVGAIIGLLPVRPGTRFAVAFSAGALCIGMLMGQMLVEFPAAALVIEEQDSWGSPLFRVHYTRWMGLSFIFLAVSIFLSAAEYRVANRSRSLD
jgi:hypothetical protein